MRRIAIGFGFRLLASIAISLGVFTLCVMPLGVPPSWVSPIFKVLNFPVALAGELLFPIRGIELLFDHGVTWCCFCTTAQIFIQQMRLAIPAYVVILYIPAAVRGVARRHPTIVKRAAIALAIYATLLIAFCVVAGRDGRENFDAGVAFLVLLMLCAAAAWSRLGAHWKVVANVVVLLAASIAFAQQSEDGVNLASFFLLLTAAVGGTLVLTALIEQKTSGRTLTSAR